MTIDLGTTDGVRDLEIRATDKLGNEAIVAGPRWYLDRTAPVTTIDSGPTDPTGETTVSFTFHADEPATFQCSLDTGTPNYAACASGVSYGPLTDGSYVFRVRGTDLAGNPASTPAEHPFIVETNQPPACTGVTASPDSFEPATRDQMKLVTLSGATDPEGGSLAYHIDGVIQDEPVTDLGDPTSPDAQLTAAGADSDQLLIRAERNPKRNGRVYRIAFTVTDGDGGSCQATVATTGATVSISRKRDTAAVDDYATTRYDSFTGARLL
ncbi:MAG: hypothetical protein ACRDT4_19020 [Micromonosporaceae bacterium]